MNRIFGIKYKLKQKDDFDELDGMKIDQKNDPRNALQNFEENNKSLSTIMISTSLVSKVSVLK